MKMPRNRDREVKCQPNSREFSRNETLAGYCLAGCGWLLLFEKTVHPWRQLGKERERHCWGKLQGTKKGIETEPTILDQVSFSCYKPLNSVHFQEEVTMGEEEGSTEEEIEKVKNEIYFEASCLYCRKVLLM